MILTSASGACYRLEGAPVAIGGQALVYRATALDDGREVAVKVQQLPAAPGDGHDADLARFEALAGHPEVGPRVAPVWDRGAWDDRRFAVLDWFPDTLGSWAARRPLGDRLAAARVFVRAVERLGAAGAVHGDLKPSNALLRDDDPDGLLLTDFASLRGGAGSFTRGYAPPEQAAGGPPSAAWDRFAAAATVWHVVSGSPVVGAALAGPLPEDRAAFDLAAPGFQTLRGALEAHLHPNPRRRPADLAAVARALAHGPEPTPTGPRAWPLALAAAALVAAVAGWSARPTGSAACPDGYAWNGVVCRDGAGHRVVPIPAGRFASGALDDLRPDWTADAAPHTVELSTPFWASDAEVTQAEWSEVMDSHPVHDRTQTFASGVQAPCATWLGHDLVRPELPVICVSWFDAIDYANARSRLDGLRPAYRVRDDAQGVRQVSWDRTADGWRLPTEAEWEWSARAGTASPWVAAPERERTCPWANHRDASALETWGNEVACDDGFPLLAPVRSLLPNPWGLHDTLGNVLEWVWDLYGPYPAGTVVDPTGPAGGVSRVLRGASWNHIARGVDARYAEAPDAFVNSIGFRVVRTRFDALRPRSEAPGAAPP